MAKSTAVGPARNPNSDKAQTSGRGIVAKDAENEDFVASALTVGVIFVSAALIEATLIPGMIVGAAAVLAPKYIPKIGAGLEPIVKSAVRGAYKFGQKAREVVAEAQEHVNDIVAEVNAEQELAGTAAKAAADSA
jgi:hypothetical protein